ncbi:hypothetical protein PR048_018304 [Dryococelus australis]|uniref:Uncharacterized protein n=1 Tax=Dryococelus australis TaxID=614101 RepID=A0ABQ9HBX2_9NEOP|nr:hypothetical protein PR048_018304 [Dryococelus australis]
MKDSEKSVWKAFNDMANKFLGNQKDSNMKDMYSKWTSAYDFGFPLPTHQPLIDGLPALLKRASLSYQPLPLCEKHYEVCAEIPFMSPPPHSFGFLSSPLSWNIWRATCKQSFIPSSVRGYGDLATRAFSGSSTPQRARPASQLVAHYTQLRRREKRQLHPLAGTRSLLPEPAKQRREPNSPSETTLPPSPRARYQRPLTKLRWLPHVHHLGKKKFNTISAYTRQKAKLKYRNRIRLGRASQRQPIDTHKTSYEPVKRCREPPNTTQSALYAPKSAPQVPQSLPHAPRLLHLVCNQHHTLANILHNPSIPPLQSFAILTNLRQSLAILHHNP